LVLSLIGAAGSASGATAQSIAAKRPWPKHQNDKKSELRRPTSNGFYLQSIEIMQLKLKPAVRELMPILKFAESRPLRP
jgi:hypothetical protein